jgi:hypothetical protein
MLLLNSFNHKNRSICHVNKICGVRHFSPHFSPSFYCGLENAAAKLVSAEIALNILSSMPRLFPLATSLFAGIFVAS